MFDDFFENNPPVESEKITEERRESIKAAVLKGIQESEEKPMKKCNIAKPFIIAAAVAALGAASLVSADAITEGQIFGLFNVKINGEDTQFEGRYEEYVQDGEEVKEYSFDIDGYDIKSFEFSIDGEGNISYGNEEIAGDYGIESFEYDFVKDGNVSFEV